MQLTPLVRAAARGELPSWTCAGPKRLAHMSRVAALMRTWAGELGLPDDEVQRWTAVGWLHDALREANPADLRRELPPEFRDLPNPLLHGPAAAERLSTELEADALDAIRFHTLGKRGLERIGQSLYLADFLEPGRTFDPEWCSALRDRMPEEACGVLREVAEARARHLIEKSGALHPITRDFCASLKESS